MPHAAAGRAVRGSRGAQRGPGIPARPGDPAARALGLRVAAVVPLDPRDAEPGAVVAAAQLLPRVLRHLVRVPARAVVQRAARRGPAPALRGDGELLHLLRRITVLPRGGTALHVRSGA